MLPLHAFAIYCGLYAIAIAVPGPGVVSIVARALGSGLRASIPAAFATALGDWILMTLSAFGLAVAAKAMGPLFLIVKFGGAAYLIYLGCRYWTARVSDTPDVVPVGARKGFLSQLSLTLGNPKAIAFFAALLPTVVDLHALGVMGYLQLSAASFTLIPLILLSYAALASRVRGLLTSRRARRAINKTAGAVLVGAGVAVAAGG